MATRRLGLLLGLPFGLMLGLMGLIGLGGWTSAWAYPAKAWLDTHGRPSAQADEALQLLDGAHSHGLRPADYGVNALRQALAQARAAGPAAVPTEARHGLANALNLAMQRYLNDLHSGRVDPHQLQLSFSAPKRPPFDAAALLARGLAQGQLAELVREAAPNLPQYQQLRQALATYQRLADHPAWQQPLPALATPGPGRSPRLDPGDAYAGLGQLKQRLQALGDLADASDPGPDGAPQRYTGPLVAALRQFQARHGLAEDAVLGPNTLAALEVSPVQRAEQIGLALERLRWTPLRQAQRMVVVNIPEFVLRAYELVDGRIQVRAQMKVIVGQALDKRTPLFDEDMRFIEFSPYWNVPASIVAAELLPRLRREPSYFDREGFEFVAGNGAVYPTLTAQRLDALGAGHLRIRQRPGPRNALGDIKFIFPNHEAIFLHHTPSVALFARPRRDFSHGCIRVEAPVALARFVLQGQHDAAQWSDARVEALMHAGRSRTLRLDQTVPVLIAYSTALVKADRVFFFNDLYGQDLLLAAALRQPRPPLTPSSTGETRP